MTTSEINDSRRVKILTRLDGLRFLKYNTVPYHNLDGNPSAVAICGMANSGVKFRRKQYTIMNIYFKADTSRGPRYCRDADRNGAVYSLSMSRLA